MRTLVESLKRMYETGKPIKLTKTQLKARVKKGIITEDEYKYIIGELEETPAKTPEESTEESTTPEDKSEERTGEATEESKEETPQEPAEKEESEK